MPALPAARKGSHGTPRAQLQLGESIEKLSLENEQLRRELHREKQHFQTMYIKDFKSPARKRLEPMKQLVASQSEAASVTSSKMLQKKQVLDTVATSVETEIAVQERRQQDVLLLEMRLQAMEERLAVADAEAGEACEREQTYAMMEARLRTLVNDDQSRINQIQQVVDESQRRLQQWQSVRKEGEEELANAEKTCILP